MTTSALLHGGQHGGWCWDLLVDEMAARGHRTVAPDMPIEDPAAGAREWARSVADALGDEPGDDVVPVPALSFLEYLGTPEGSRAVTMPVAEPLARSSSPR